MVFETGGGGVSNKEVTAMGFNKITVRSKKKQDKCWRQFTVLFFFFGLKKTNCSVPIICPREEKAVGASVASVASVLPPPPPGCGAPAQHRLCMAAPQVAVRPSQLPSSPSSSASSVYAAFLSCFFLQVCNSNQMPLHSLSTSKFYIIIL